MDRRAFIGSVASGLLAVPLAARAQKPAIPVIGFLSTASRLQWTPYVAGFHHGLNEAGYVEGKNVAIEFRWAEGYYDRLPSLAAELASRQVAVLVATGGAQSVLAAKAATSTIPIVFTAGGDLVALGLVASLGRPGGNVTGVRVVTTELVPKRLGLLHELVPNATVIALLVNPDSPSAKSYPRDAQEATPFCPKTRAMTSRRFAIVEVEHPTESLVPADNPNWYCQLAVGINDESRRGCNEGCRQQGW
jgi:putative ABC transport system substrate-binding protein